MWVLELKIKLKTTNNCTCQYFNITMYLNIMCNLRIQSLNNIYIYIYICLSYHFDSVPIFPNCLNEM